jgi:prophage regulatory protein
MAKKADVPAVTDSTTDGSGFTEAFKESLPFHGFTRWEKMKRIVPFSRETTRKLEKKRRFPQRVHITPGVAAWPNSEIHRWLSDPRAYHAPASDVEPVIGHKRAARAAPATSADPAKDLIELEKRSLRLARLHAADQAKKAKAKSLEPKAERSTIKPESRPAKAKATETA